MRFGLLGPLEVLDDDGVPVELGGRQPRTMLAVLLAAGGRAVPVETIVDAIWGADPPASATGTMQSYVSRLRKAFGAEPAVVFSDAGYQLVVAAEDVDFRRFEEQADAGHQLVEQGRFAEALVALEDAERLWRGPALGPYAELDFAVGLATRLDERRLRATEDRLAAQLALGRHAAVVGELGELAAAHPLREELQAQRALALYRSGRQAEALRAIADASRVLRDELGIEPGRDLRDLEAAILAHDPSLDGPPLAPEPSSELDPARPGPLRTGQGLVGRDVELAALLSAFDEAADDARFVVVEGEPGIGKTRLVDELRVQAGERGALSIWGRSDEGGAAPALWPWLLPLREIATRLDQVPEALDELLTGETPMSAGQAQSA